jgi:single-strand DNA-binding protein
MALHKLTIIGRLVGEPRINVFGNGGKVAHFGLPVNFTRRQKNPETGEWEGESFIIDVSAFNRENGRQLADVVEKYLHKGSQVYVEGRLRPNEYTDRNGVKVFKPVLTVDVLELLDRPSDGGPGQGAPSAASSSATRSSAAPPASGARPAFDDDGGPPPNGGHQEEEIPF